MYTDLFAIFLHAVRNIIVIGAGVAMIIVSILIIANKTASTKILGIGYLVAGLIGLADQSFNLLMRYGNMDTVVRFSVAIGVANLISILVRNLTVSIFLHKNYGKKLIYIPLMLLPVVSRVADYLVRLLINASPAKGSEMGYWMLLTSVIDELVTGTATSVIIIVILYMNSKKEQVIPKAWIFRTVTLLWSITLAGFNIIYYSTMLAKSASDDRVVRNIISGMAVNSDQAQLLVEITGALVMLVIPVYVLLMANKASKKENIKVIDI